MTDLFQITPTPPTTLSVRTGKPERFSFTVKSLAAPDQAHDVVLQDRKSVV